MFNGKHFYNQTLKKTVAVFGTLFNNIKIVRQGTGEARVPIAYGPRKKFLARIQADTAAATDKSIAIKLPRMSFEITDISFDTESKLNKFNKRVLPISGDETKSNIVNQSVPYNVSMQLNIYAKNQDDVLQIFEQILPTFAPEYTVAIKDMEGPGTVTDVPIVLTGTSIQDDYEGDFQTRRSIIYALDFTMKVRFAGGVSQGKIIRTVDTFFYTDIENPSAQVNNSISDTATITIDNVIGSLREGQTMTFEGMPRTSTYIPPTIIAVADTLTNGKPNSITVSSNQTIPDNTKLTFINKTGEENVRIAVDAGDEPPLDDSDTITTTFGFDYG
jgi:hypothetical protein